MTHWKFIKSKKGFEITKKEDDNKPYSLGTVKTNLVGSLVHMAHHFQENDIIDTDRAKEDLIFWHEDYDSLVLQKGGFTNNTVWFPRATGMGDN